jgi:hypothetical protein
MATQKQWLKSIRKWIERFGLSKDHRVRHEFVNDEAIKKRGMDVRYAAGTNSLPEYKDHYVDVGLPWLHGTNSNRINEISCHEAVHMVTSPTHALAMTLLDELPKTKQEVYREWWHRENEEVTTQLTNIILRSKEWKN